MDRLKDKVAIVTGAGSGIGRASAKRFAQEGAAVVAVGMHAENVEAAVEEIKRDGGCAIAVRANVGIRDQVKDMIDMAIKEFGTVDVLFNNVANMNLEDRMRDSNLLDIDVDLFHKIMDVNVLGGVLACQYALPHMIAKGSGSIIFTSSAISLGGDIAGFAYGASKAAMNWYVKAFAVNFGKKGIRCNGILPGVINSPALQKWTANTPGMYEAFRSMSNAPRFCEPEDVAAMALFLASDESAFVNGALILVDGAMTCTIPFTNVVRSFTQSKDT